ncbi:unnamed protein product [Schistosoma curassoni]|uniref:Uncharacterized protein n=1 Tax=Schistosoma curassoni TaxID=6186 RepID=A0A183JZ23_9TREM|nr:unnamed protein product [Schistosoma curassoni]
MWSVCLVYKPSMFEINDSYHRGLDWCSELNRWG